MQHNEQRSAKRAFWKGIFARQKESGLGIKEFCAREHLAVSTYRWWKKKLEEEENTVGVSGFVEIETKEGRGALLKLLKIIVPGICILEVQEEISPEYIARLVQKLREVR